MSYFSKEDIIKVKRLDLYTYLKNYNVDELVHFSRDTYVTRSHDSLKISNGMWYWFSQNIGGKTALEYLIKVEKYSFTEAVSHLLNCLEISPTLENRPIIRKNKNKLVLPKRNVNNDIAISYLEKRGIDREIIDYCIYNETIYEDINNNVVFIGADYSSIIRYAGIRGTKGVRYLKDAYGSDKNYSFKINAVENSDTVHIFESAIDLLSFATLLKMNNKNWSDQLTKINEKTIIYDDIGNPIQIGSNIHLNWINGRELKEYNDGINQIKYKYNISGVRTEKIINNDKTSYFIEGSNIVFEKNGKNMLYYIRSNMDDLLGFKYNDRTYYYVKNIHDDIIAILNSSNQIVAKYQYDSWGNILSITDSQGNDISADINHIANINPYRYRSYYYDKEIKMYYLNDRYYNPLIGRFINPDITTGEVGGNIIGHNMYQYAFNNSINFDDSNGDWPKWLKKSIKKIAIGAAVIAVGVIITAATGGAALPALGAGITAALVTGAIAGTIRAATSLIKSNRSKNNTSSTKRKSNTKKSSGSSSTLKETGKSFVEGFADGFMYGGILAGSAQMISGCFKISTNLGVVGGKNSGINISNNIKVLSPNAGFHTKNIGGTIIKFGENVRLDVGSSSLFHTHGFGIDHLPFGIFSSGLYGGLKK